MLAMLTVDAEPSCHAGSCVSRLRCTCRWGHFPWCLCPMPGLAGPLLSCGLRVGRTPARHCIESIGEWSGGPEEDGCGRVCHDGGQTEERWDPVLGFSHLRKLGLVRL